MSVRVHAARNAAILRAWNEGRKTMTELGAEFGISRSAISGVLARARQDGQYVMAVDAVTAQKRKMAAIVGAPGYAERLAAWVVLMRARRLEAARLRAAK